jgi:hypothetical protein
MTWKTVTSLIALSVFPPTLLGVNVMVNEYCNGAGTVTPGTKMSRDEYLEFVIVDRATPAELSALTFGDANDATSMMQGVFKFDEATLHGALASSGLNAFLPGTIITVKGTDLGTQNLSYNPTATNMGDHDAWSLELVAGQGALDHPETFINGNTAIANNGDIAWVSSSNPPSRNTDFAGVQHAIGHDNNPGSFGRNVQSVFGNENLLGQTIVSGQSVANIGDTTEQLAVLSTATLAAPNGGLNDVWVNDLRTLGSRNLTGLTATPEPTRALLLLAGLFGLLTRRTRRLAAA